MPAQSHLSANTNLAFADATLSRMPVFKVTKKIEKPSFPRLSPLAKGRIIGLVCAGESHRHKSGVEKTSKNIYLKSIKKTPKNDEK